MEKVQKPSNSKAAVACFEALSWYCLKRLIKSTENLSFWIASLQAKI
jgi:hypothetical protein